MPPEALRPKTPSGLSDRSASVDRQLLQERLRLIFSVTARFGYDLLLNLLFYVLTVVGALVLFEIVVYPAVLVLAARRSPREFFRQSEVVLLTAFSTSSSNATLPTSMRVAREGLGIPAELAGFVLPLGATLNMNGSALFEGATVLFLAQVFGVELTLGAQLVVVVWRSSPPSGRRASPGARSRCS